MARDFTINLDNSWMSGSIGGNAVQKPFIQAVNNVPSLKNTSKPYELVLGDKLITGTSID